MREQIICIFFFTLFSNLFNVCLIINLVTSSTKWIARFLTIFEENFILEDSLELLSGHYFRHPED